MTTSSAGKTDPALVACKTCGAFGASWGETDPVAAEECPWCYRRRLGWVPVDHNTLLQFLNKGRTR